MDHSFVLLLSCPDQRGVVAKVAAFIHENGGNIYNADQHFDAAAGQFFARFAWHAEQPPQNDFTLLASSFGMDWRLFEQSKAKLRTAIFVSKYDHCLYNLLVHQRELDTDFICIVSNHEELRPVAEHFGLPFCCTASQDRYQREQQQLDILRREQVELLVLARYMQILSGDFLEQFKHPVINIHHSFLPAFKGAKPYHQAYERGVKIIGATSHYVTEDLDQGPIIAQGVLSVSHRDSIKDLVRKGRSLEKQVLLEAIQAHSQHRVLTFQNKTIVFQA